MASIDHQFEITDNHRLLPPKGYFSFFILLFMILLLAYSNSFVCFWQFDDFDNIIGNANLQINTFSWEAIHNSFFGIMGSGRWSRPLSYFSFALNYYIGGYDVFIYHVFNFAIHYLTAVFLFLFIYNTIRHTKAADSPRKHIYTVVLLATLLWALHPIHVTAVTYIVQRMASMAGLFYIMTLYFYLKGRTCGNKRDAIIYFSLCFVTAFLAFGTKENTAMLPVTLYLYDLFLFQGPTLDSLKKSWRYGLLAVLIFIFMGLLYASPTVLVGGYEGLRPFTMGQRLLTQPFVLIYYISLLFFPVTSRLTLIHDIPIAKTLFDPWFILPALLAILLIIGTALYMARKAPLISFCIVFFFLNHLIEGSFLSLEMAYEHRNYIPAMLFFVPLAMGIVKGMDIYYHAKKTIFYLICFGIMVVFIIQGITVYIQNDIFYDEVSLWTDNVEKMPYSQGARHNLGHSLLKAGKLPEALAALQTALTLTATNQSDMKYLTYMSLGDCYFVMDDMDNALLYIDKALKRYPLDPTLYNRKAEALIKKGKLREAKIMIKNAILLKTRALYHVNYAEILLKQGDPDAAIREARRALEMRENVNKACEIIADAYKQKKNEYVSAHFAKLAKPVLHYP